MIVQIKRVAEGALFTILLASMLPAAQAQNRRPNGNHLVSNALSAAPRRLARDAAVAVFQRDGRLHTIRHGRNGITCLPDDRTTPWNDPMCADAEGLLWIQSWHRHEPRPANTRPGVVYMMKGGFEITATRPWEIPRHPVVVQTPHMMMAWPFNPADINFPDRPTEQSGIWVMWPHTPYAHVMINGNPPRHRLALFRRVPG